MQKLDKEALEFARKKFKHWMDDIQVLVYPSIVSSLFFGTRRSSAAFYNPIVAFKDIRAWLQNVNTQLEKHEFLAQLLGNETVQHIKHALMITDPKYLEGWKHDGAPIKGIATLYAFLALHMQITEDVWRFYHRMWWLLEREFRQEG
jgi:hypothetical protein